MADVGELVIVVSDRPGTGHIDGNEPIDAAFLQGVQRRRITAELLGHGEYSEAKAPRLVAHDSGVRQHRVEVE